ncbi:PTS transporter subunit EIIC, partial [Klebsiella pneumoniae]|uniref:PTS transporter subunit EIIC n=1 Tax=Klebsiella pneumoniae TaxID=573 RepID=UPI001E2BA490
YFNANIYVNALIALSLVSPGIIELLTSVQPLILFNIPVKKISYGNMLFPVLIATIISCFLEKGIDKFMPNLLKLFVTPALTLAVMVPLILLFFGPMGELIGEYLTYYFTVLYNFNSLLCAAIIAPAYLLLCIFGLHWFLVPIMLNNISQTGWDPVMGMCSIPAWVCMGVSLNMIWRSRSHLSKGKAVSAGVSAIFGIVEPTLFPILIALKKPLVMVTVINIILGAVLGMFDIAASGFLPPGPTATALFIGHGAFKLLVIGFCGSLAGFIGMWFLNYREIPSPEKH